MYGGRLPAIRRDYADKQRCPPAYKLWGGKCLMLRNLWNFDKTEAPTEFWYIIKDSFGGMEELSTKVRNQVRRSFNRLDIRRIDKTVLLDEGYDVYRAAWKNYKLHDALYALPDKQKYLDGIRRQGDNVDRWGAFDKETGRLVAYCINSIEGVICNYYSMKALPEFQKNCYPYYGLLFEMNRYYLQELGLRYVCDGARTVTEHSGIQDFLEHKFKFRKAYCNMRIFYRPWLRLLVNLAYPFRRCMPKGRVGLLLRMEEFSRKSH